MCMPLGRSIDSMILSQCGQAMLAPVSIDHREDLRAGVTDTETGMRRTHRQRDDEYDEHRYGEGGAAQTHVDAG